MATLLKDRVLKLPKTQIRLIEMTRRSPLIKTLSPDQKTRWCLADGTCVGQQTAENIVARGLVQPLGDGLFGDSQSYAVAR